jgi:hypothetical protein
MTKRLDASRLLILFAVACLLTACVSFLGPRDVEIPLAKLQQKMSDRFPFNNRYHGLLDVTLSNPQLAVQPDSNRLFTSMDATITPTLFGKTWKGSLAVSGVLRADPSRNALMLSEPRVEKFNIDGLDARYTNVVAGLGTLLTEQVLQDRPLYTFGPDELRYAGTNFTLAKITTRTDSIVVTFAPAK